MHCVQVACYSKVLSERDHRSFVDLFVALEVQDMISYSTLGGLVNSSLESGALPDLRDVTKRFLEGRPLFEPKGFVGGVASAVSAAASWGASMGASREREAFPWCPSHGRAVSRLRP